MQQSMNPWTRTGLLLVTLIGVMQMPWPRVAAARGGSRDPMVQWEHQRKRTEDHKSKRREQLDLQGAETRDAKKSAEDSRQSQMQTELGNPNPQADRWTGY